MGIVLVLIGFLNFEYETVTILYLDKTLVVVNFIVWEEISHLSEVSVFPFNLQTPSLVKAI